MASLRSGAGPTHRDPAPGDGTPGPAPGARLIGRAGPAGPALFRIFGHSMSSLASQIFNLLLAEFNLNLTELPATPSRSR